MSTRTIYCRHDGCLREMQMDYGSLPSHCPNCGRRGRWSFEPKTAWIEQPLAYLLTDNDKAMLKRFGVKQD